MNVLPANWEWMKMKFCGFVKFPDYKNCLKTMIFSKSWNIDDSEIEYEDLTDDIDDQEKGKENHQYK